MALQRTNGAGGPQRLPTGYAEEVAISDATFRATRREYEINQQPSKKRKREDRGDPSIVNGPGAYKGPWAAFTTEAPDAAANDDDGEDYEEVVEIVEGSDFEEDTIPQQPAKPTNTDGTAYEVKGSGPESTEEFGDVYDYQGRSYLHVPNNTGVNFRADEAPKAYTPKRVIHTWKKHTKTITQTRFLPGSGHLLLSASADTMMYLWNCHGQRELLRGFYGHTHRINDIDFEPDGRHFISGSYDRTIKRWDTETGECDWRYSGKAVPHCLRVNPSEPWMVIAGMSDNKIQQFDTRISESVKPVQEYDHHLGPVNTITFCDDNRRFMSTSDDKSLRAWEVNIPVPIKIIAEPHMFAMSRGAPHPSGKYVAYQAANEITVYSCTEKFRQNRKKDFRGHNNAGYGIDVAFSADGSLVASGDANGNVCFWDWKTCKLYNKLQATKGSAVLTVQWHPRETSKVVTGDIDGTLKYWD